MTHQPIQTIKALIDKLKQHPHVIGLVEYGADHHKDHFATGDYDLFVIMSDLESSVESLHFYVGEIPIDLNFRSFRTLCAVTALVGFERALLRGRVIYDTNGVVSVELMRLRQADQQQRRNALSEHDIAFIRYGHTHIFDKMQGRLDTMPVLSRLLLHANTYWLLQSYFHIHGLLFQGEKDALAHLAQQEPVIYAKIEQFYTTAALADQVIVAKELSELVLAPIGGLRQQDELLVFGDDKASGLQGQGKALLEQLLVC